MGHKEHEHELGRWPLGGEQLGGGTSGHLPGSFPHQGGAALRSAQGGGCLCWAESNYGPTGISHQLRRH